MDIILLTRGTNLNPTMDMGMDTVIIITSTIITTIIITSTVAVIHIPCRTVRKKQRSDLCV
jgi:uncharacterized membrane protein YadS